MNDNGQKDRQSGVSIQENVTQQQEGEKTTDMG
jgi:hypothetical protein